MNAAHPVTLLASLVLLVPAACGQDHSSSEREREITWFEMISDHGMPLPAEGPDQEILSGWLEVHPEGYAVWRVTMRMPGMGGDGLPLAMAGAFSSTPGPAGVDSVSFFVWDGYTHGTLEDGILTFPEEFVRSRFRAGKGDIPPIIDAFDLVSAEDVPEEGGGDPDSWISEMDGGWLQIYGDGTWTWLIEDESDSGGRVARAAMVEVVSEEGGVTTVDLFLDPDPGASGPNGRAVLAGDRVELTIWGDLTAEMVLVFERRP